MKTLSCQTLRVMLCTCVAFTLFLASACEGPGDARAVWKNGIKKCAKNDLLGSNVLFFGPSNALGPGTIFQNFTTGGTQVSFLIENYQPSPAPSMAPAQSFGCSVDSAVTFKMSPNVSMDLLLGASGSVGVDLKRATNVKVQAQSLQWDQLVTGPYRQQILSLPAGHPIRDALLSGGHLVLARALRVKGMQAELEFSESTGVDVKAKIPNGAIGLPAGSTGVGLSAQWTGNTKLTLTAPSDFYIAGELRRFSETGLAGSSEIGDLVTGVDKIVVRRTGGQ